MSEPQIGDELEITFEPARKRGVVGKYRPGGKSYLIFPELRIWKEEARPGQRWLVRLVFQGEAPQAHLFRAVPVRLLQDCGQTGGYRSLDGTPGKDLITPSPKEAIAAAIHGNRGTLHLVCWRRPRSDEACCGHVVVGSINNRLVYPNKGSWPGTGPYQGQIWLVRIVKSCGQEDYVAPIAWIVDPSFAAFFGEVD
jgi:hypothetical protein